MSDSKNMFDQIFNAEHFKNPFFGNAEAFQKAWQDTLQKNQIGFSQSSEQSIEELDKRINELKSVENWLSLNLSMLKNTIQSLELQRTNLQSLQEMMQNNDALQAAGQQWWNSLQEQFQAFLKNTIRYTGTVSTKSGYPKISSERRSYKLIKDCKE